MVVSFVDDESRVNVYDQLQCGWMKMKLVDDGRQSRDDKCARDLENSSQGCYLSKKLRE